MGEVKFQEVSRVLQNKRKRHLSKQLSLFEAPRDIAWERKKQLDQGCTRTRRNCFQSCDDVTDEDLDELKGCIELGFGFNEEDGQELCNTLPALDLYFAVNRQLSPSPVSTPHSHSRSSSIGLPVSNNTPSPPPPPPDSDSWKICNPGDDPEHVKTKLRHWAQAVACSVMQSH